jgi:putative transposase
VFCGESAVPADELGLAGPVASVDMAAVGAALAGVGRVHLDERHASAGIRKYLWGEHFWSPSYFAGSCGGAPLSTVKDYIENQKRPT